MARKSCSQKTFANLGNLTHHFSIMAEFDPKTSLCKIIKFDKTNPDNHETVLSNIQGEAAAKKLLHKLRKDEPERERYGYYWTWVNKKSAREAKHKQ
jgi:hypothetical protein